MIGRRTFITGLGGAAAWPVVARAQQVPVPVIGVLGDQSAEVEYKNVAVPFLEGLKETGYVVGQNVAVEYRYAENQLDRLGQAGHPRLLPSSGLDRIVQAAEQVLPTAMTRYMLSGHP